jgi:hypothetical protein
MRTQVAEAAAEAHVVAELLPKREAAAAAQMLLRLTLTLTAVAVAVVAVAEMTVILQRLTAECC